MIDAQLAGIAKFCRERDGAFSLAYNGLRLEPSWSALLSVGLGEAALQSAVEEDAETPEEALAGLIDKSKIDTGPVVEGGGEPGPWRGDAIRRGLAVGLGEDVADYLESLVDDLVEKIDGPEITFDPPEHRNDALAFLALGIGAQMQKEDKPR